VTLPSTCSWARPAACGCHISDSSSANSTPRLRRAQASGAVRGTSLRATGASTDSASQPPSMKIDTSTGWSGGAAAAAWAMPSRDAAARAPKRRTPRAARRPSAAGTSVDPCHCRPAVVVPARSMEAHVRRARRPARSSCARVKSLHEQLAAMLSSPAGREKWRSACAARSGASPGTDSFCHFVRDEPLQTGLCEGFDRGQRLGRQSRVRPIGQCARERLRRFLGPRCTWLRQCRARGWDRCSR